MPATPRLLVAASLAAIIGLNGCVVGTTAYYPDYGPGGYDYLYYPSSGIYYDNLGGHYYYPSGGTWIQTTVLPSYLYSGMGTYVVLNNPGPRPWYRYDEHRHYYPPESYRHHPPKPPPPRPKPHWDDQRPGDKPPPPGWRPPPGHQPPGDRPPPKPPGGGWPRPDDRPPPGDRPWPGGKPPPDRPWSGGNPPPADRPWSGGKPPPGDRPWSEGKPPAGWPGAAPVTHSPSPGSRPPPTPGATPGPRPVAAPPLRPVAAPPPQQAPVAKPAPGPYRPGAKPSDNWGESPGAGREGSGGQPPPRGPGGAFPPSFNVNY